MSTGELSANTDQEIDANTGELIYHVRADKGRFDTHNLFVAPLIELLGYGTLIHNIITRDLKVRYKRSTLGIAWTILAPLFSMMVLWVVFTKALGVQKENYAVYLLSGLITWNLFLQSSSAGCASVLSNVGLIQKIRMPRVIFPISAVINNLVNFAFAFCALLIVIVVTGAQLHWTLLLTPIVLIPVLLFSMGWAMLVSSLSVFFRDIQYILEIVLGALFYLTPILYPPENVPAKFSWSLSLNPIAKFIHLFRVVAYAGELPQLKVYFSALGMGLILFVIGWIVFQRLQRSFIYWL